MKSFIDLTWVQKRAVLCIAVSVIFFSGCFSAHVANAFENIKFIKEINTNMDHPADIATSVSGDIYVVDEKKSRILDFGLDGSLNLDFGKKGGKIGQFKKPRSIAISPKREIVVADTGNNRIQVFNKKGKFQFSFGASGSRAGQFRSPSGVSIDQFGFIYVADTNNKRVQVFTSKGIFLRFIETASKPVDIGIDPHRNLYVLMSKAKKIVKYSAQGKKIKEITVADGRKNFLLSAGGIGVDLRGDIYVTEKAEQSIKKINDKGKLLLSFGSEGDGRGQFKHPSGIFCDTAGRIFIADSSNKRIQVFLVTGSNKKNMDAIKSSPPVVEFDKAIPAEKSIVDLSYVAGRGIYSISEKKNHILFIGSSNDLFGKSGRKGGEFKKPQALSVMKDGQIFIADTENNRVQVLNPDGTSNYLFGKRGKKTGQFSKPAGIAVSDKGIIYVSDTENYRVQIFNSDLIYLSSFGGKSKKKNRKAPAPKGSFIKPGEITIDKNDNVYVLDSGNNRVQMFDKDGQFKNVIGKFGKGAGQFNEPVDIAKDEKDFLFVADRGNSRIQIFDSKGNFILAFGSSGKGSGYFKKISAVSASRGKIYVADYTSKEIQVFNFYPNGVFKEDRLYASKTAFPPPAMSGTMEGNHSAHLSALKQAINELADKTGASAAQIEKLVIVESEEELPDGRVNISISIPKQLIMKKTAPAKPIKKEKKKENEEDLELL